MGRVSGLTLLELLIAVSLTSVVIFAGVKADQLARRQVFGTADIASQQHRARVALQHMRERIGWARKKDAGGGERWGSSVSVTLPSATELIACEYESSDPSQAALNNTANYRRIRYQFVSRDLRFSEGSSTGCGGGFGAAQTLLNDVDNVQFALLHGANTVRVDITIDTKQQIFMNTDILVRGAYGTPGEAGLKNGWN